MNKNNTQTAVEWLAQQINTVKWKFADITDRNAIIQQAKQMEKKQILDAWDSALINTHIASNSIGVPYDKEKYYQETYEKGIL